MKKMAVLAVLLAVGSGYAIAQDTPAKRAPGAKLSQSECSALWNQANPGGAPTISEAQAQPYVTDFQAANPDGDGTLDQNEFLKACNQGLVKSSAASGASPGASGKKQGY